MSAQARIRFEEERRRSGVPGLGIQIAFLYGCGGAGFRIAFTADPHGPHSTDVDGVGIAADAESAERLDGAVIDWEPLGGFVLRHPDASLVEFC
jgi:Fe-S cluster assembly iron-binding protein IscA